MSRESGISKPAALIGRVVVSPTLWKSYVEKLRRERKKRGQTHMLLTGPPPDARNGGFDWPSSKAEKSRCSERHAARHPCKPTMDGVQQRGTAPCVFQRFPFISYLFIYLFFGARGAFELCAEFTAKSRRWNGSGRRGGGGGGTQNGPYSRAAVFGRLLGKRHAKDKDRPHLRHQAPSKTATNALGGDVEFQTAVWRERGCMWLTTARGPGPNRLAECRDWVTMRMAVGIFCRDESRRRETTSRCFVRPAAALGSTRTGAGGRKPR